MFIVFSFLDIVRSLHDRNFRPTKRGSQISQSELSPKHKLIPRTNNNNKSLMRRGVTIALDSCAKPLKQQERSTGAW
jgi:hypothetical protein